mmetsp:Transcript_13909/g.35518  ORF Transcript_13909/g.35518 Transcript_13909/m.35518 type:complete len:174 (+) Transcript_13909:70-591(+)
MQALLSPLLSLSCLYRTAAAVFIDAPLILGCPLRASECTALMRRSMGFGLCEASCTVTSMIDLDSYLDIDPVIDEADVRTKILVGLFAFLISPWLVSVCFGGLMEGDVSAKMPSITLAIAMFFLLLPLNILWMFESPQPALVILYNLGDFVFIPLLLCYAASKCTKSPKPKTN